MTQFVTAFVSVEVALQGLPAALHDAIDVELRKHGEPLRWAVTAVNEAEQKAIVEAIVTTKVEG